jgi:hypothetical protein
MKQEKPTSLNSLLTNRDPEEVDYYLSETFNKHTLEEVILGLLCLRLPEEVAARRASMVAEDMAAIGFSLRLEVQRGSAQWLRQRGLRIPIQYYIPDTGWTVNRKDSRHALEGTHLDKGDLLRLSKVCELGRTLLPNDWPHRFADQLNNPSEHLDAVNEVWWLGRFKDPTDVKKLDTKTQETSSPDWSFSVRYEGTTLRLRVEVKRRCSDIKRHLAFSEKSDLFDKISSKFSQRSLAELNIAGVTTFSQIDNMVAETTTRWLENEPNLDAVILWSEQSFASPALVFVRRGEIQHLLRACLNTPDEEDTSGVAVLQHLVPDYPGLPRIR